VFDKVIRYGAVREILGPDCRDTILEVGAGPHGLGCCLPFKFVGVDSCYPEPPVPTQTAVLASGTDLPFADRSFDVVLCLEVLEHIPPQSRARVVSELCRVARKTVIITHPYGFLARFDDYLLAAISSLATLIGKNRPSWLREHLQNPYPEPKSYLRDVPPVFAIRQHGQENALLHPGLVLLSTLTIITQRTQSTLLRRPDVVFGWARRVSFWPYCRLVLVLSRTNSKS
jgi:hypothetical protein